MKQLTSIRLLRNHSVTILRKTLKLTLPAGSEFLNAVLKPSSQERHPERSRGTRYKGCGKFKMRAKNNRTSILLLIIIVSSLALVITCENPGDLEAVSGVQGIIQIQGVMPDSIKAVALVILEPEAINDQDNIGNYLINYSEPLYQSGEYYTQLKPGQYMVVIVGLLVDPGLFAVNIDNYLESADLPIVQLSEGAHSVLIREKEMQNLNWEINF